MNETYRATPEEDPNEKIAKIIAKIESLTTEEFRLFQSRYNPLAEKRAAEGTVDLDENSYAYESWETIENNFITQLCDNISDQNVAGSHLKNILVELIARLVSPRIATSRYDIPYKSEYEKIQSSMAQIDFENMPGEQVFNFVKLILKNHEENYEFLSDFTFQISAVGQAYIEDLESGS